LKPAALADRIVDHPGMRAEHVAACRMDDPPGPRAFGTDRANDTSIVAVGYETDVLAVRLGRDGEAEALGDAPHLGFGHAAEGEPQEAELRLGRAVKEVGLIARRVECTMQFGSCRAHDAPGIVPGGE